MNNIDKETRSKIMRGVKSKGNRTTERRFRAFLISSGIRGWHLNDAKILGTPDLVFEKEKIVVFLDGCFWHGCSNHLRMPSSNQDYWITKIDHNKKRDKVVTKELKKEGWKVVRIWEHSIKNPHMLKWWVSRIKNLVDVK